jgi:hypothetical protein
MSRAIFILFHLLFSFSIFAVEDSSESNCGDVKFRVIKVNHGQPLENSYSLKAITRSQTKEIYFTNEDWFKVACISSKSGKPILVFQNHCGGSGCLEGKYGAVDPSTLKLLLRPSEKNIENFDKISEIIGSSVQYLENYKGYFCCGKSKHRKQ